MHAPLHKEDERALLHDPEDTLLMTLRNLVDGLRASHEAINRDPIQEGMDEDSLEQDFKEDIETYGPALINCVKALAAMRGISLNLK